MLSRSGIITGNHNHAHTRVISLLYRIRNNLAYRIDHPDKTNKFKIEIVLVFRKLALSKDCLSYAQNAQPFIRH